MSGVACTVGHDEPGSALGRERGVELLNPQVVRIVRFRDAERKPLVASELLLANLIDVERRIGHHEVERTDHVVRVLVVGIGQADVAGEPVEGEVHLRQRHCLLGLLSAEDGESPGGVLVMAFDELGALDEHAARPAGGVQHAAVERFENFHDEPDDGVRREELAAALAFLSCEVGEEVLVDQAERVTAELLGQRGEEPQ